MASNINTTDVDETYPVAGQDNDSQGFRDNFSTIKNNFIAAKAEVESLQTTTAKLNADNDFSNNKLVNAVLVKVTEDVYNAGNLIAGQNISFNNGHYQTQGIGGSFTLTLSDWPANGTLGKIRAVLSGTGVVTFSTEAGGTFRWQSGFPFYNSEAGKLELASPTAPKIVDFWTDDGGVTVYGEYVGQFGN